MHLTDIIYKNLYGINKYINILLLVERKKVIPNGKRIYK